jgi:integrase
MAANLSRFSLYKRQNQIYCIGYYVDGRRRWKSTGVTTKPDALKRLTAFRELLNERSRCVMLQQFISDFLVFAEANYRPNTLGIYRRCLERFSRLAGNITLKEVTAEHFDKYKTKRFKDTTAEYPVNKDEKKRKAISPTTVNIELRALRAAFKTAKRWKLIDVDPFDGVTFAEVAEQVPLFFTSTDFQTSIDCIREGWFKEVVLFAALTGMRRGEILNLK